MIFIDSNIPMYLVGGEHPHKRESVAILERFSQERRRLVTNVEVIQEILHRYTAINRRDAIQPCIDALYDFIDKVEDITEPDVLQARDLLFTYPSLSARDALHAAFMKRMKIDSLFSFDSGFDNLPFLKRLPG